MKVREYIESRPTSLYNRQIRVLDAINKKYLGTWLENADRYIINVKATTKIIFIFV